MSVDYTKRIDEYLKRLFPIARSITGDGNRETLKILQEVIPLEIKEYPSGSKVYDWEIPREWKLKEAWIKNSEGKKIIDFADSNLHVVGYSEPINKKLSLKELKEHLFYIENLSEAIPYRTSYYKKTWGFCLSLEQFKKFFREGETYEVLIDSEFKSGSLTVGEYLIPGRIKDEILISTYICHPSLANDNLSGAVMTAFLSEELQKRKLQHSFRVIFVPETIGAIAYCAFNEEAMKKIDSGFVVTCVGGTGRYGFKQSFDASHPVNPIVEQTLRENGVFEYEKYLFDPHGSDERQYSSQAFRINIININKDRYYNYRGYHTSLDNLDFVKGENINKTLNIYLQVIEKLDTLEKHKNPLSELKNLRFKYSEKGKTVFKNQYPHCEIMLSKHGLYPELGGAQKPLISNSSELDMVLWLLFYCDGILPLGYIAEKTLIPEDKLYSTALILESKGLIERMESNSISLEKIMITKNDFDGNLVYGGRNFHKTTNREKIIVHKKFPHYEFMDYTDSKYVAKDKYFEKLDSCILCDSKNLRPALYKDGLVLNQCLDCSFGFQNPRFRKEYLYELYYGEYSLDATYVSEPQKKLDEIKFKYAIQNVRKHLPNIDSVLDIGAGNLHFLKVCMSEGVDKLYGIEPGSSPKDETGKIHVVKEFSETIPSSIKDVSLITMWDTLEHVHDIKKSIQSSYETLKEGGILVVMVPNFMSLASRLIREKSPTFCVYHLNYFTADSLEKLLMMHGFKVLRKETIISEIDNCRNYLEFQEPYMSSVKNEKAFDWLTPEYIHENLMGSRLFFMVQK